eukprot:Polyplicarium_translucidae@DN2880_c0_g1_i4.p1
MHSKIWFLWFLAIEGVISSFIPGTERWTTEELGQVKALHHNEMSQFFSPVGARGNRDFFFVYTTPDLVVRVAHYQEGLGGAPIRIRDEPLVDECYKRSASWKHDFSLGVDELGYLHVAGDMDEYPYYEQSRHGHLPPELKGHNCLFWRSVRPGDSRAFVFVGHLDGGEGCPIGDGFSRLRFTNDRNGRLFAHYGNLAYVGARNDTDGRLGDRGLGMSRYDPYQKKWILIGRSWRSDWGEMSRTALNVDEQNVNGPFQESYRDVVFDRHGVAHLCSVTRYLTREYVTYALSDATDYNTWETRHRDSLSLPITTAPPAEIIADLGHGWPMMISEDGLYRFSTTESADFKSSLALQSYMFPLKASQLVVNQAHIGRTGVIAALATRFAAVGPVAKQSEPLASPLEDPDETLPMAPLALVLLGHFPTDQPP